MCPFVSRPCYAVRIMNSQMTRALGSALLLTAVAGAWWWNDERGQEVQAVSVMRSSMVQSVLVSGRISVSARIDMGSDITAMVTDVLVQEGDRVKAGDVLVRLSDHEARAALSQARAALAEARASADHLASVAAPVARQGVVQAEVAYHAAERDSQRARELVAQGFFSQQKLDDALHKLDIARSELVAAGVQSQARQTTGVDAVLASTRVEQAAAAVELAGARMARLRVLSPMDATVLRRTVEPGSMAQPGRVLLSLAAGELRVETAVDEKYLHVLSQGMPARVVADAYPSQFFEARLSSIAPAVDAMRGTVEVRLALLDPPAVLRPDMTVSIELVGGIKSDALVLPAAGVRNADGANPWALVPRGGRAEQVPVKVGRRSLGSVEITAGLGEGDEVIPQFEKAVAGDRVRVRSPQTVALIKDVRAAAPSAHAGR